MAMCQPPVVANNLCLSANSYCNTYTVRYPASINDAEWERRVNGLAAKSGVSFVEASSIFRTNRWKGFNYEQRPISISTLNKNRWRTEFCLYNVDGIRYHWLINSDKPVKYKCLVIKE